MIDQPNRKRSVEYPCINSFCKIFHIYIWYCTTYQSIDNYIYFKCLPSSILNQDQENTKDNHQSTPKVPGEYQERMWIVTGKLIECTWKLTQKVHEKYPAIVKKVTRIQSQSICQVAKIWYALPSGFQKRIYIGKCADF